MCRSRVPTSRISIGTDEGRRQGPKIAKGTKREGMGCLPHPLSFFAYNHEGAFAPTRRSRRKPLRRPGARTDTRLRPPERSNHWGKWRDVRRAACRAWLRSQPVELYPLCLRASVSLRLRALRVIGREAALRGSVFAFFAATAKASALSPTTTETEASLRRFPRALCHRRKPTETLCSVNPSRVA